MNFKHNILDIGYLSYIFDHNFDFFIKNMDKTISTLDLYLSTHNIQNIDYLRITHTHEIYSRLYFNDIPIDNLKKLYDFLDKIGIRGIILKDNNLDETFEFSSRILHESHPYFLGMTHPHEFVLKKRKFDKKFLCLNLLPRPHKTTMVEFLYNNNIDKYTNLTHNFKVLDMEAKTLELDLEYDALLVNAFSMSSYIPTILNHKSFCNIVTETCFHATQTTFITEKTEKCFSAGQPFIMVSTPFFLKNLRELGYQTFGDFWDESYDLVVDNEKRMKMIYNQIIRINYLSYDEIEEMYVKMLPILRHNQRINREWYLKNINRV